jgi:hypothetical protein
MADSSYQCNKKEKPVYRVIKVTIFSWSSIDFMLNIFDKYVIVINKRLFLGIY